MNSVGTPPWRRVLAIIAIAGLIRLLYVLTMVGLYGVTQTSDFYFMDQLAQSMAAGQGFTLAGERIYNQSIGYPALLAVFYLIFGSHTAVGLALNVLLGAISTGLVYLLAGTLLRDASHRPSWLDPDRTALLAAALVAIYPDSLLYASVLASENLVIPLLVATYLAVYWRPSPEWLSGAATGVLAAFTASAKAQVLFAFVLIPLIWRTIGARWIQRTLTAAIAALLVLAPWTYLNYRDSGGYFVPFSAIAGEVFLDGTNPLAHGTTSNVLTLGPEVEAGHNKIEIDRMKFAKAVGYVKADPVWYVKLELKKLVRAISPIRDFMFEDSGRYRLYSPLVSRWLPTLFNLLLGIGLVIGTLTLWRDRRVRVTVLTLLAGMIGVQLVFIGYSRYRFPYLVCLLPVVAVGLEFLARRLGLVGSASRGDPERPLEV